MELLHPPLRALRFYVEWLCERSLGVLAATEALVKGQPCGELARVAVLDGAEGFSVSRVWFHSARFPSAQSVVVP